MSVSREATWDRLGEFVAKVMEAPPEMAFFAQSGYPAAVECIPWTQ